MNLLKVVDLSNEDQATLVKLGFGDLLTKAGTSTKPVDKINLELEMTDELKASTIMLKFIAFRASDKVDIKSIPRRMQIQMRFFTFPEIQTDVVSLVLPGNNADL
jgi:hypothetical protein